MCFTSNRLQKWYSPVSAFLAQSVHDEEDIPDWNDTEGGQANKGTQLDSRQAHELDMLLGNFESLFTALPAHTTIAEHCIPTRDARPVRLPPYCLPHAFRDQVKEELDDMLVHGFIEHSKSNWYFFTGTCLSVSVLTTVASVVSPMWTHIPCHTWMT